MSDNELKNTCQICGRPIKAKNGLIAHHGYKRPNRGSGWQTASCMGARFLPYEVSYDRLPTAIAHIKAHISNVEANLSNLMTNPPQSYTIRKGYYTKEETVVTKPDNFNPTNPSWSYAPYSYESHFRGLVREYQDMIKLSKIDLQYMEKRLADWVPVRTR